MSTLTEKLNALRNGSTIEAVRAAVSTFYDLFLAMYNESHLAVGKTIAIQIDDFYDLFLARYNETVNQVTDIHSIAVNTYHTLSSKSLAAIAADTYDSVVSIYNVSYAVYLALTSASGTNLKAQIDAMKLYLYNENVHSTDIANDTAAMRSDIDTLQSDVSTMKTYLQSIYNSGNTGGDIHSTAVNTYYSNEGKSIAVLLYEIRELLEQIEINTSPS